MSKSPCQTANQIFKPFVEMPPEMQNRIAGQPLPVISIDLRSTVSMLQQYHDLGKFRSAFITGTFPVFDNFRTALANLHNPDEPEFHSACHDYLNAIQVFLGLINHLELINVGRDSIFWKKVEQRIVNSADSGKANLGECDPRLIFDCHFSPFFEQYGLTVGDANNVIYLNDELLERLLLAWVQEAADLRSAAAGIDPIDGILPIAVILARCSDYTDFRSKTIGIINPAWNKVDQNYQLYNGLGFSEFQSKMITFIRNVPHVLRTAFGFEEYHKPPDDTQACRLWDAMVNSMPEIEELCRREAGTPQSASELVDYVVRHLPEEFLEIFFQADSTGGLEINRHGLTKYLLEQSLDAGREVPMEIMVQYPDLIAKYGV